MPASLLIVIKVYLRYQNFAFYKLDRITARAEMLIALRQYFYFEQGLAIFLRTRMGVLVILVGFYVLGCRFISS